ncbi:MAG: class I SAM-dependent methyltransferase [Nitrospirota bacterium]|nr:class I SAM-dependent methyltransferase [Nitrospirota bacterium]MDE3243333.1 class I SAM-dependent methyltransferase [Nitrospirota bacterium]
MAEYIFERAEDRRELERLRLIERVFDPASRRLLLATGLRSGWACLEIGPGAGSILAWLGTVVGPTGLVTGVEINPRFLQNEPAPPVQVIVGDIRTVSLPLRSFDLVHARFLLIHLADPGPVLDVLRCLLKPGGRLVLEEPDFSASLGVTGSPGALASVANVHRAIERMFAGRALDHAFGSKLPSLLRQRGWEDLSVEREARLFAGGSDMARMMRLSAVQLREQYLATGAATEQDIEAYCRFADDPETGAVYHGVVRVTARTSPRS